MSDVTGDTDRDTSVSEPACSRTGAFPKEWEPALKALSHCTSAVTLVCGPKNSGKSTLARHILLHTIKNAGRVHLLDIDCGQPEFGPAGFVSLTPLDKQTLPQSGLCDDQDPPTLLLNQPSTLQPERMLFVGDVSAEGHPALYSQAVLKLLRWHFSQSDDTGTPVALVINTPGWVRGQGLLILHELICAAQPTLLIELQTGVPSKDIMQGALDGFEDDAVVLHLPALACLAAPPHPSSPAMDLLDGSPPSGPAPCQAAVEQPSGPKARADRMLAWSAAVIQARGGASLGHPASTRELLAWRPEELARALCSCPPVMFDMSGIAVVPLFEDIPQHELAAVLNGALVALVHMPPFIPGTAPNVDEVKDSFLTDAPWSLGLGLVHAVEMQGTQCGKAYVHTPAAVSRLATVNVFCVGRLQVPVQLLAAGDLVSPYLAPYCPDRASAGARAMRSRKNLQRISLLES